MGESTKPSIADIFGGSAFDMPTNKHSPGPSLSDGNSISVAVPNETIQPTPGAPVAASNASESNGTVEWKRSPSEARIVLSSTAATLVAARKVNARVETLICDDCPD